MRVESFVEKISGQLGRMPRIALYGLGSSNEAMQQALTSLGVSDLTLRSDAEVNSDGFCHIYTAENAGKNISEDVWILSPSVRRDRPVISEAIRRGVRITSDCEIFFADRGFDCIGITGSDGKSTTAAMCAAILSACEINAPAIGNIGVPYCTAPAAPLYVTELSSFNLNYLTPPTLRAAITNVTENHLNWHRDFAEYRRAKANLLLDTKGAVLSADDPECVALARERVPFAVFSVKLSESELRRSFVAEHYLSVRNGEILLDGESYVSKTDATATAHGKLNAMAAVGLTLGLCRRDKTEEALHSFRGLMHRGTPCGTVRGVEYIDFSIDTTPLRVLTTLRGLNRRVHLLLGGRGKGLSLEPLAHAVSQYALRVGIYGESGAEMLDCLTRYKGLGGTEIACFPRFDEAFAYLSGHAKKGDTVVLSPGATAYGEFRDYRHRAERFTALVKALEE